MTLLGTHVSTLEYTFFSLLSPDPNHLPLAATFPTMACSSSFNHILHHNQKQFLSLIFNPSNPFLKFAISFSSFFNPLSLFLVTISTLIDGNQVEDAQAHEAQAQRITRSMARALGQEYNKMALLISFIE